MGGREGGRERVGRKEGFDSSFLHMKQGGSLTCMVLGNPLYLDDLNVQRANIVLKICDQGKEILF